MRMSDWEYVPPKPGPNEYQCTGCRAIRSVPDLPGMEPRMSADGQLFCVKCPACPCGRPECNADAKRATAVEKYGAMLAKDFVLNEANHYIHVCDRLCGECGKRSGSMQDMGNLRPKPEYRCWVCNTCIHDKSGDKNMSSFRVRFLGRTEYDDDKNRACQWDVHATCLHCPTCNFTEPPHSFGQTDVDRDWAITVDRRLVHVACATCEFCKDPRGKGKKIVTHMWTEGNPVGVVHKKHDKEITAALRAYTPLWQRKRDVANAAQGSSRGVVPAVVNSTPLKRTRRPTKKKKV